MLEVAIKGFKDLKLQYLVLDLNGISAVDGVLVPGVTERIEQLKSVLEIYLVSADTFGTAKQIADELGIQFHALNSTQNEAAQKAEFVKELSAPSVVAIGNGRNNIQMLKVAEISIVIIGTEGASGESIKNATIVVSSPLDASGFIDHSKKIDSNPSSIAKKLFKKLVSKIHISIPVITHYIMSPIPNMMPHPSQNRALN